MCVALALLSCKSYSGARSSAYVGGRIHTVTGKVSGTDNQLVKKGDLLVEVDPVDYDVRVERLQKQL
ncbi:MAG: biotin/lipoyl-binding protein [Syntrophorhabdales bacterium]|jgi:multidrug resistance efflux pump